MSQTDYLPANKSAFLAATVGRFMSLSGSRGALCAVIKQSVTARRKGIFFAGDLDVFRNINRQRLIDARIEQALGPDLNNAFSGGWSA